MSLLQVTTQAGNVFHIDTGAKTWHRLSRLRPESGTYTEIKRLEISKPMTFQTPPRDERGLAHFVQTTPVTEILTLKE